MFQRHWNNVAAPANLTVGKLGLDRTTCPARSSERSDNADSCLARHTDALPFRVWRAGHAACAQRQNEEKRQQPHGNTITPGQPVRAEIESPAPMPSALSLALIPGVRSWRPAARIGPSHADLLTRAAPATARPVRALFPVPFRHRTCGFEPKFPLPARPGLGP